MELEEIICKAIPITSDMCRFAKMEAEHRRTQTRERIEKYVNEKILSLIPNSDNEITREANNGG